jgi:aldose 1-epimerase
MTIHTLRSVALGALAALLASACHRTTQPPTSIRAPAESTSVMSATPPMGSIVEAPFGVTPNGDSIHRYTLTNPHGMQVRIITYGGIIQSITVPDRHGQFADVVLGYDSLAGYLHNVPYFGAIVGRYANRIAKGRFKLDGKTYQLATNNGPNALHGGVQGFDKVVWQADSFHRDSTVGVTLSHTSPDSDQGYPGAVVVGVTYALTPANTLEITYLANAMAPTPFNVSQHSYFNLAGEGHGNILGDTLTINADHYTPVDSTLIPTGVLAPVAGTPLDFRQPTVIGARIADHNAQLKYANGYDQNFVLNHKHGTDTVLAARVVDPGSGRVLTVSTTQPGLQFYTGNFLDSTIVGKGGHVYGFRGGLALETQHFPDSPNHANFPSTILRPDHPFRAFTVFAFGVEK